MKRSKENQEALLAIDRKADILKAWLLCKRVRIQQWACALRKKPISAKMAESERMEVDSPAVSSTSSGSNKKRFEVKKVTKFPDHYFHSYQFLWTFCGLKGILSFYFFQWNAVALWAWGKSDTFFSKSPENRFNCYLGNKFVSFSRYCG